MHLLLNEKTSLSLSAEKKNLLRMPSSLFLTLPPHPHPPKKIKKIMILSFHCSGGYSRTTFSEFNTADGMHSHVSLKQNTELQLQITLDSKRGQASLPSFPSVFWTWKEKNRRDFGIAKVLHYQANYKRKTTIMKPLPWLNMICRGLDRGQ